MDTWLDLLVESVKVLGVAIIIYIFIGAVGTLIEILTTLQSILNALQ